MVGALVGVDDVLNGEGGLLLDALLRLAFRQIAQILRQEQPTRANDAAGAGGAVPWLL